MKKVFDFVASRWEMIFTIVFNVFLICAIVWFAYSMDNRAIAYQRSTFYDVYCVAQSGEVLFDGRVADARTDRGTVTIHQDDASPEQISIVADCRVTPVKF